MKLDIINLLPESTHKHVITKGFTTTRAATPVKAWYNGDPCIGLHYVTDGNYLYSKNYWNENDSAVLIGEVINSKKVLYDYTDHFRYDNKDIKIENRRTTLMGISIARNIIVKSLNWKLPDNSCTRFELCRTRHSKSSDCSGFQLRFHGVNRRIFKTHHLYDVYKYGKLPLLRQKEFDAIFFALDKEPRIVKPQVLLLNVLR